MCLITATARKLDVSPQTVFYRAAQQKGFTNALEISQHRFKSWFYRGEIPLFVETFCLNQWRVKNVVAKCN